MSNAVTHSLPAGPLERRRSQSAFEWRLTMLIVAMIAVAILFGFLNPYYLSFRNALDLGRQASLLAAVAIGAHIIIVSGEIDLSIGAVVGLLSVSIPGMLDLGLPLPVVLALAVLLGAAAGALNGFITLQLMVPSFLATLGTMAIYRGLAIHISNQPRTIYNASFVRLFNNPLFGIPLTIVYPVVLTVVVALIWRYTRFGVFIRAVGSNEQSARYGGLNTWKIKFMAFTLAGVFSAIGACLLLGRTQMGLAVAADGLELNAIAAVILGGGRLGGGKGSVIGTFLGAILLTMIFSGIAGLGLNASWQLMIKGAILVAVIVLMRK
jgi:ribose transport system permease protein